MSLPANDADPLRDPCSPGELLKQSLGEHCLPLGELARRTGLGLAYLIQLVGGDAPMTEHVARELEVALGIPVRVWLRLEENQRGSS